MSICNFRCAYCYLAQRDEHYQGRQVKWGLSVDDFKKAFSTERLGGKAFFNVCADGETLLATDLVKYVRVLLEEGHYVEIVTNATITSVLNQFLMLDEHLLKHLEFKCSFHYMELKRKNMLEIFADNVNSIWRAGSSACIELTPSDDQIPYLEEIKEFSMEHFGALPHITIARDDRTRGIEYLTALTPEEYSQYWSGFNSAFWDYKRVIFGKKQTGFCYAGKWSSYIDVETGNIYRCYGGQIIGNAFRNLNQPLAESPIGRCPIAHCYNGHALLTLGLIPENDDQAARYGDIRDRVRKDGSHWLQKEFRDFINTRLKESNEELGESEKRKILRARRLEKATSIPRRGLRKVLRLIKESPTVSHLQ